MLGSRNWREVRLDGLGVPGADVISIVRINSRISDRREHVHRGRVELIHCIRGEMLKCSRGGAIDTLSPGEVLVAFPRERHCVLDGPKGRFTYTLRFRLPRRGEGLFGLSSAEARLLVERLRSARRIFAVPPTVAQRFQTILRVWDNAGMDGTERTIRIRHALDSILLAVCDAAARGVRATKPYYSGIAAVVGEMRGNPLAAYPLDDLCRRTGMSKPSFIAHFKSHTGSTPHAYLLKCRVDSAKKLLKGKRSVASIAQELGFSSPQHFTKAFRETTGVAPSRWGGA